jgi:hypothetical protein
LDHVDADFFAFVEHDRPAYYVGISTTGGFTAQLVQSAQLKAIVTVAGRRIAADEYARLREAQRNPGDPVPKQTQRRDLHTGSDPGHR